MLALVLSLPPELVDGVNEARHRVGTFRREEGGRDGRREGDEVLD
jgi:hypothetical protein